MRNDNLANVVDKIFPTRHQDVPEWLKPWQYDVHGPTSIASALTDLFDLKVDAISIGVVRMETGADAGIVQQWNVVIENFGTDDMRVRYCNWNGDPWGVGSASLVSWPVTLSDAIALMVAEIVRLQVERTREEIGQQTRFEIFRLVTPSRQHPQREWKL